MLGSPYIAVISEGPLNQAMVLIFSGRLWTRNRTSSPSATRDGTDTVVTRAVVDRCQKVKRKARRELRKKNFSVKRL